MKSNYLKMFAMHQVNGSEAISRSGNTTVDQKEKLDSAICFQ
ncbi:hypothetical protein [Desulfosediminicola sp.]